jgi:two-component system chemotaxis response regulator CheB
VTALRTFVSRLPENFPAPVLVVLHIPARGPTLLPEILSRAGPLPGRYPADGEPLAGVIISGTMNDGAAGLAAIRQAAREPAT